jgi:hypothetical protein
LSVARIYRRRSPKFGIQSLKSIKLSKNLATSRRHHWIPVVLCQILVSFARIWPFVPDSNNLHQNSGLESSQYGCKIFYSKKHFTSKQTSINYTKKKKKKIDRKCQLNNNVREMNVIMQRSISRSI